LSLKDINRINPVKSGLGISDKLRQMKLVSGINQAQ
jgi:hypothetical protein